MSAAQPSAGELAMNRAALAATLPDRATIEQPVRAPDGRGGQARTWAVVDVDGTPLADVPFRAARRGNEPDEQIIAEQLQGVLLFTLTFPHDIPLQAAWRVRGLETTYEIVGPLTPRSNALCARAVCKRIEETDSGT